ncbi:hypothetical protein [Gordonia sp. NPDC003950]
MKLAQRVPPAVAAAVIIVAGFAACTVEGDPVADPDATGITTTETTTTTDDWDETTTETTSSSSEAPISDVPAPANATTMTCREFVTLDRSTQVAVLRANGATADPSRLGVVVDLMSASCPAFPDTTIADILAGNLPTN